MLKNLRFAFLLCTFTALLPSAFARTLRELQLMRNTIYARAGNEFRKRFPAAVP